MLHHTMPSVDDQEFTQQPSLAETLQQVTALNCYCSAVLLDQVDAEWMRVSDCLKSGDAWVNGLVEQIMTHYAAPTRQVAASFLMGWYAWYVAAPSIACYLLAQQVPTLTLDAVAIRFGSPTTSQPIEIALLSDHYATVGRAATEVTPHHQLVPSRTELRTLLRLRLEAHLGAIVEQVATSTRLGRRGLWNQVADTCAEAFLRIGERINQRDHACEEGMALIQHADSPMRWSTTRYQTIDTEHACHTFRMRGSCCLFYKVPAGTHCHTCPLLEATEQEQRLRGWIAQHHA